MNAIGDFLGSITGIDIVILLLLLLGTYLGWRKGLIKSVFNLVGLVAIVIISYSLRYYLAEILIDKLPFFNFFGFEGLVSLNILVYNVIAFVIIFILLYCILNIILAITGIIDTILKFTVIWILPSKIGGAILGFLETWIFLFLAVTVLMSVNVTSKYMLDSKVANFMIEHTPVVGNYLHGISTGAQDIYNTIKTMQEEGASVKEINEQIYAIELSKGLILQSKYDELREIGKIDSDIQIWRPTNG